MLGAQEAEAAEQSAPAQAPAEEESGTPLYVLVGAGMVVLLALGAFLWWWFGPRTGEEEI